MLLPIPDSDVKTSRSMRCEPVNELIAQTLLAHVVTEYWRELHAVAKLTRQNYRRPPRRASATMILDSSAEGRV